MELVDMSSLDQQLKLEADDKICKLASDNTLKTFVGEYRKRKQSKSMPASSNRIKLKDSTIKSELYQEINRQQKSSYLKVRLISESIIFKINLFKIWEHVYLKYKNIYDITLFSKDLS